MSVIRVAILTVSDTASKNASADNSGPTIKQILDDHGGYTCIYQEIVPDDESQIAATVKSWCSSGTVDLVLTTGGTGFGQRDRTPEALTPLIERPAPGIVHLVMAAGVQHTPLAALSRPVAGTIGNALVVTLPGSVKAVKENVGALLVKGFLEHAVDLVRGGSGKEVHSALAKGGSGVSAASSTGGHSHHHHHHDHGHGHHHHHGHEHHQHHTPEQQPGNDPCCDRPEDAHGHSAPKPKGPLSHDPSQPASTRHRTSPYPLISLEEGLSLIKQHVNPLEIVTLPVTPALRGHILAEDVHAPHNVPRSQSTNVDGYAILSTNPPGTYPVLTSQTHRSLSTEIPSTHIYRINTGSPLPAGTDSVVMVEDTRLVSTHSSSALEGEEKEVEILVQAAKGDNVRQPGSDVKAGDLVLEKAELIRSGGGEIGTLVFVGRREAKVYRKPIVALLSTGNEIIDVQKPTDLSSGAGFNGVYDTNRPSLQAVLEGLGYGVVDLGVVPDDLQAHIDAIKRGLDEADILLTTGGTSMGASDLLKPVIERHFNGTVHFGRSTIKPGKPTTFATIPHGTASMPLGTASKPMFALAGNPASALVTFYIYVVPALRRLGGWTEERCELPRIKVEVQNPMPLDTRTEFHRVVITSSSSSSILKAYSTGGQRSSRIASLSGANGLVILPKMTREELEKEGGRLEKGSVIEAVVIGEIGVEY